MLLAEYNQLLNSVNDCQHSFKPTAIKSIITLSSDKAVACRPWVWFGNFNRNCYVWHSYLSCGASYKYLHFSIVTGFCQPLFLQYIQLWGNVFYDLCWKSEKNLRMFLHMEHTFPSINQHKRQWNLAKRTYISKVFLYFLYYIFYKTCVYLYTDRTHMNKMTYSIHVFWFSLC